MVVVETFLVDQVVVVLVRAVDLVAIPNGQLEVPRIVVGRVADRTLRVDDLRQLRRVLAREAAQQPRSVRRDAVGRRPEDDAVDAAEDARDREEEDAASVRRLRGRVARSGEV